MHLVSNLVFVLVALITDVTTLPTESSLDLNIGNTSSWTHSFAEKRFAHGKCSFHATVEQHCIGKRVGNTFIKMRTFLDNDGNNIAGLTSDPNMFDPNYVGVCGIHDFGNMCPVRVLHGFDGKDLRMKGYQWKYRKGEYWFKMTYEFDGCQWDEDNSVDPYPNRCGAYCTRGAWTRGSDFCHYDSWRTHEMDCFFKC